MGWMQNLYEMYPKCVTAAEFVDLYNREKPWPVSHIVKQAHIEIILDGKGNFRTARALTRDESRTLIPATENSASRTSDIAPHPLCEEISYCALDLPKTSNARTSAYLSGLSAWHDSTFSHPKLKAILTYVRKASIWKELYALGLFPVYVQSEKGKKAKLKDDKVFIRWRVEAIGEVCSGTWEDQALISAWAAFDKASHNYGRSLCVVSGEEGRVALKHPRFLRYSGDGGKLVSSNDSDGFTFRGRFTDGKGDYGKQACSVSYEVSQKAHNALRWLIKRQSYRMGDQVFVTWANSLNTIPDPFGNSLALFENEEGQDSSILNMLYRENSSDVGQSFATHLKQLLAGYRTKLGVLEGITIMGLDSSAPGRGRMSVTHYRQLNCSEFLERVEKWHEECAWYQTFSEEKKFIGAPSPYDIATAIYKRRSPKTDEQWEKFVKITVARIFPSIIEGQKLPEDIVRAVFYRACNRISVATSEWEKILGVACSLFRFNSTFTKRRYAMALETERTDRDYLYGRLLAIAERMEEVALRISGEKRSTNATRMMQKFSNAPCSTWKKLEEKLVPYKIRLRSKRPAFLKKIEKILEEVIGLFCPGEFEKNQKLSCAFLLGYHLQKRELRPQKKDKTSDAPQTIASNSSSLPTP